MTRRPLDSVIHEGDPCGDAASCSGEINGVQRGYGVCPPCRGHFCLDDCGFEIPLTSLMDAEKPRSSRYRFAKIHRERERSVGRLK